MLNNISWPDYWYAIITGLVIYYAYVFRVYYYRDLGSLFGRKNSIGNTTTNLQTPRLEEKEFSDEAQLNSQMQSFSGEISAYLEQAAHENTGKPEILFALRQIARKYDQIKDSSYQSAINKLIRFECEDKCAVTLNEDELLRVWVD